MTCSCSLVDPYLLGKKTVDEVHTSGVRVQFSIKGKYLATVVTMVDHRWGGDADSTKGGTTEAACSDGS